jgi:c-di-GMP-binding flagellar brake protein YcgR
MKNNRRYKRYSIRCNGKISDDHHNYKFIMNDISAGGMKITTDSDMKDANPLTIQLDASQIPLPHSEQLQGVIVRKEEDNTGFSYGIRFLGLSNTDSVELDDYLGGSRFSALVHMVENPSE